MKLSANFALDEFLFSETAQRNGIDLSDPPEDIVNNLQRLCIKLLEPMRNELCIQHGRQVPIVVTSGWRPEHLNTMIGGSKTSDHIKGLAADVRAIGVSPYDVARAATVVVDGEMLPAKQIILEFGRWVHLSIHDTVSALPKVELLTATRVSGRTQYNHGLITAGSGTRTA